MRGKQTILRFWLVLIGLLAFTVTAAPVAENNPFAWDLSYSAVFKNNAVPENDTVLKYFRDAFHQKGRLSKMALPAKLFEGIDTSVLKTAILIDSQAFWYLGHRICSLYLDDGTTVRLRTYDSKRARIEEFDILPDLYATFAASIMQRKQSVPLGGYDFEIPRGYSFAGYVGVISTYSDNGTGQQLITIEDLLDKQMQAGEFAKSIQAVQQHKKPVDKQAQ